MMYHRLPRELCTELLYRVRAQFVGGHVGDGIAAFGTILRENSIDANAKTMTITRGREHGEHNPYCRRRWRGGPARW